MDKKNIFLLSLYVSVILVLNLFIAARQLGFTNPASSGPSLDYTKEFANELVANVAGLAEDLGVKERSVVKLTLAQLHYDVTLASTRSELARIIQNNASTARQLIINEFVKTTGEQVLLIINNSGDLQNLSTSRIRVEPLPDGGMQVVNGSFLRQETQNYLHRLPTIFSFEGFRPFYAVLKNQTSFELDVEGGIARMVSSQRDQQTIAYWEKEIQSLRSQYNQAARGAGLAEVSGRGVVIRVYDGAFLLNASDLRHVVNELFSVGASAMTVGGVRFGLGSYIMETDSGLEVDGQVIGTNPVTIVALGDPNTLLSGVSLLFDVVFGFSYGVESDVRDTLTLPAKTSQ